MKSKSLQWLELGATCPKKVIRNWCDKKTMLIVFFDDQGIVHVKFVPPKMIVTSNFYCGVLASLRENIRRKRPVLWKDNSYLILRDNALGHKAAHTITRMAETDMQSVRHPPYSLDLAPCDFWLFPTVKKQLAGIDFHTIPEVQDAVFKVLQLIPSKDFYDCINHKLPEQWRKCYAAGREYFEGDNVPILYPLYPLIESGSSSDSD